MELTAEYAALAAEIQNDRGCTAWEASARAHVLLPELLAYAQQWDAQIAGADTPEGVAV